MSQFSPLRYPGGKGKLAPYFSEVLSLNSLEGGHYAEPFAGGAAVALELLFSERIGYVHINDLDPCVYAFWNSAVNDTDALVKKIKDTNISVDTWLAAREVKRHPESHSMLDLGFSTFFLNRTNRSGILNGGIIGGLEQKGEWKIGCRFNKDDLIARLQRVGFFRSRISVHNMDASLYLSEYVSELPKKSLLYIDPPYYVKGACLYQNYYKHDDHVDLAKIISGIIHLKWIVSYDNVPEVCEMYKGFDQEIFDINYTARSYSTGTEVMVFSHDVERPQKVYCSEKERKIFYDNKMSFDLVQPRF